MTADEIMALVEDLRSNAIDLGIADYESADERKYADRTTANIHSLKSAIQQLCEERDHWQECWQREFDTHCICTPDGNMGFSLECMDHALLRQERDRLEREKRELAEEVLDCWQQDSGGHPPIDIWCAFCNADGVIQRSGDRTEITHEAECVVDRLKRDGRGKGESCLDGSSQSHIRRS